MKKMNRLFITAGIALMICLGVGNAFAQRGGGGGYRGGGAQGGFGGGNFDPAQLQQQVQNARLDNYRRQLEITKDDEWAVIKVRIQKVMDAQQGSEANAVGGLLGMISSSFGGGGNRGGRTGGITRGDLSAFGGGLSPEEEALQKAVEAKAANTELKTAMTKVIKARKASQDKLEKAQDELRSVLSYRQEAIAMLIGLL